MVKEEGRYAEDGQCGEYVRVCVYDLESRDIKIERGKLGEGNGYRDDAL